MTDLQHCIFVVLSISHSRFLFNTMKVDSSTTLEQQVAWQRLWDLLLKPQPSEPLTLNDLSDSTQTGTERESETEGAEENCDV